MEKESPGQGQLKKRLRHGAIASSYRHYVAAYAPGRVHCARISARPQPGTAPWRRGTLLGLTDPMPRRCSCVIALALFFQQPARAPCRSGGPTCDTNNLCRARFRLLLHGAADVVFDDGACSGSTDGDDTRSADVAGI